MPWLTSAVAAVKAASSHTLVIAGWAAGPRRRETGTAHQRRGLGRAQEAQEARGALRVGRIAQRHRCVPDPRALRRPAPPRPAATASPPRRRCGRRWPRPPIPPLRRQAPAGRCRSAPAWVAARSRCRRASDTPSRRRRRAHRPDRRSRRGARSASNRPLIDVHLDGRSSGTTTASWFEASSTREPGRTKSPSWAICWSSALTNTSTGAPARTCRTSALDAARFSTMRAESRASNARLASVSTSLRLDAAETSTSSRSPVRLRQASRRRAPGRARLSIWIGSSRYQDRS